MRLSLLLLAVALGAGTSAGSQTQCPRVKPAPVSAEPAPWESDIAQFEAADILNPPPKHAVLFVGGSSITLWPKLEVDFPRADVIQRGFGGAELSALIWYAPRVILPYCPRLIVVYAGDNDLASGRSPDDVLKDYKKFVAVVHGTLPETRIAFIAIKPSSARVALLDKMRAANALVRRYASTNQKLLYVDVFTPMLGANGLPRDSLFQEDKLHLNTRGYALWRDLLEPIVNGVGR